MKRTLAITAATAMLALSLAGCGAERNGDMDLLPDFDGANGNDTTATDTMRNDNSLNGTGTSAGASSGLNSVTGAVNRGAAQYGSARYGATSGNYASNSGRDATRNAGAGAYTATNNGGMTARSTTDNRNGVVSPATVDRYALMLENGRVHDSDGFLLDGENASWRTF